MLMILALLQANKQEATRSNEASEIQLYWGGCRNPSLNKVGMGSSFFTNSVIVTSLLVGEANHNLLD